MHITYLGRRIAGAVEDYGENNDIARYLLSPLLANLYNQNLL